MLACACLAQLLKLACSLASLWESSRHPHMNTAAVQAAARSKMQRATYGDTRQGRRRLLLKNATHPVLRSPIGMRKR